MVMQYPDIISFQSSSDAVYDDNTGTWTPGTSGTPTESRCRYETSSGNGWINTEGGQRINYSGVIYLPKDAPVINTGSAVVVTVKRPENADQVIKDKVLRFFRGQMNARIWV